LIFIGLSLSHDPSCGFDGLTQLTHFLSLFLIDFFFQFHQLILLFIEN